MFNNHVFDEAQEKYLQDYLSTEKIIVLLDPPFGGRVEPLAHTIKSLSKHLSKCRDGKLPKIFSNLMNFNGITFLYRNHIFNS